MKPLIALISCHARQAYADVQRSTWIPRIPEGVDYKFFRGRGAQRETLADEIFLDCDDSYEGIPNKVQEVMRWSLAHGYDFTLKCDDDVLLLPEKFSRSGFERFDFVGNIIGDGGQSMVPWGFCWVLSRRSMEVICNSPLPTGPTKFVIHPEHVVDIEARNDEFWVASTLLRYGIRLTSDERYRTHKVGDAELLASLTRPNGPLLYPEADPTVFAYCMFYEQGKKSSDEENLSEMKKIWERLR